MKAIKIPSEYRLFLISGGIGVVLVVALFLVYNVISAPAQSEAVAMLPQQQALSSSGMPIKGWRICVDLGVGKVPGRVRPRQRFVLCHPDGWEIKTYCMNPDLPNPAIGAKCTRIGEKTYWCGKGVQPVKEFIEPPPPTPNFTATFTPTPTATNTPTPTPTSTPTPTPTPTERPQPGGPSPRDLINPTAPQNQNDPSATRSEPFRLTPTATMAPLPSATLLMPTHPSPNIPLQEQPLNISPQQTGNFYGVDFNNHQDTVLIKIFPANRNVNGGKPIRISFIPGQNCKFGDKTACVNTFKYGENGEIIYLSIHSGIGGQAEAFRHAMEGTGFDQATLNVKAIRKNVQTLVGARVIIYQGNKKIGNFVLAGLSRVPSRFTKSYFELPLPDALYLAAGIDDSLKPFINPEQPQIVFETCGWRAPGEAWVNGLGNTSASVYVGVIREAP